MSIFAFDAGERAYDHGREPEDNPHEPGTESFDQWRAGWRNAWWAQCGDNPMLEGENDGLSEAGN